MKSITKVILTSLVVTMVLVTTIPTDTPIYPVQENWVQQNNIIENFEEDEMKTLNVTANSVVLGVSHYKPVSTAKRDGNYKYVKSNVLDGVYSSLNGVDWTKTLDVSFYYSAIRVYNNKYCHTYTTDTPIKIYFSTSDDGDSWAAASSFNAPNDVVWDVMYIGTTYYIMAFNNTTDDIEFYDSVGNLIDTITIDPTNGGAGIGYYDSSTSKYYFPVSTSTTTKIYTFDGANIVEDEVISSTVGYIKGDTFYSYLCKSYSKLILYAVDDSLGPSHGKYILIKSQSIWNVVYNTLTTSYVFVSFEGENYDVLYLADYDETFDLFNFYYVYYGTLIKFDTYSSVTMGNTRNGWGNLFTGFTIGITDKSNFLGATLTQNDHLSPRTVEFFDESASVVKGQGMVIYDKNSNLIFTGKISNLVPDSDITGITSYKVQCEELATYDLNRPITADAGYTNKDPHEPIDDALATYCLFLYEGTLDDQSLAYDLMWKKDMKFSLIADDGEEIGGKHFHWDPDGKSYFDDSDLDPTCGAITLDDTNCHLDEYGLIGKNQNKVEIRGGVTSAGVPVYGTYTELKETDLSVGTDLYEVSGLVDDDSAKTNAIAERLHDKHNHDIHYYKGIIRGVGCPETCKIATYSSTANNLSSRTIIFEKIVYDIDIDSFYFEAYDYVVIIPDSTKSTKEGDSNTNRVYQVAGGSFTGGGIENIVEDLTPQLGGDLDCNGYTIINVKNNTYITWVNAAGDGTVNAIKVSASDIVEIGTNFYVSSGFASFANAIYQANNKSFYQNIAAGTARSSLLRDASNLLQIGDPDATETRKIRLNEPFENNRSLYWRNAANDANIECIKVNDSDKIAFGAQITGAQLLATTLASYLNINAQDVYGFGNNGYIRWYNAAWDDYINCIKVDTDDEVQVAPTDAPSTDTQKHTKVGSECVISSIDVGGTKYAAFGHKLFKADNLAIWQDENGSVFVACPTGETIWIQPGASVISTFNAYRQLMKISAALEFDATEKYYNPTGVLYLENIDTAPWYSDDEAGADTTIVNDINNRDNCLYLQGGTGGNDARHYYILDTARSTTGDAIEFAFNSEATYDKQFYTYNTAANQVGIYLYWDSGTLKYSIVGSSISTGFTYTAGTWNIVRLANINYTAHTYDIWVNCRLYITGAAFYSATSNDIKRLYFRTASSTSTDNKIYFNAITFCWSAVANQKWVSLGDGQVNCKGLSAAKIYGDAIWGTTVAAQTFTDWCKPIEKDIDIQPLRFSNIDAPVHDVTEKLFDGTPVVEKRIIDWHDTFPPELKGDDGGLSMGDIGRLALYKCQKYELRIIELEKQLKMLMEKLEGK